RRPTGSASLVHRCVVPSARDRLIASGVARVVENSMVRPPESRARIGRACERRTARQFVCGELYAEVTTPGGRQKTQFPEQIRSTIGAANRSEPANRTRRTGSATK